MSLPLIEYRLISLHPTCIGNERIRLEMDGRIYSSKNSRECDEGQLWSAAWQYQGRIDATALAAISELIASGGVIDLPETMVDPLAVDGKREELEVCIAGTVYCRALHNVEQPAFHLVVRHLRGLLMDTIASSASAHLPSQ